MWHDHHSMPASGVHENQGMKGKKSWALSVLPCCVAQRQGSIKCRPPHADSSIWHPCTKEHYEVTTCPWAWASHTKISKRRDLTKLRASDSCLSSFQSWCSSILLLEGFFWEQWFQKSVKLPFPCLPLHASFSQIVLCFPSLSLFLFFCHSLPPTLWFMFLYLFHPSSFCMSPLKHSAWQSGKRDGEWKLPVQIEEQKKQQTRNDLETAVGEQAEELSEGEQEQTAKKC